MTVREQTERTSRAGAVSYTLSGSQDPGMCYLINKYELCE